MSLRIEAEIAAGLAGTARSILESKGSQVHSIAPGESVYAAVDKLNQCRVGALLVMQGSTLVGVISERDYARKIILEGQSSKETRVEQIMSAPVICIDPSMSLAQCLQLVTERRIRHLPVVEAGKVIGVISIGDLVRAVMLQQKQTLDQLNTLITDPYPR